MKSKKPGCGTLLLVFIAVAAIAQPEVQKALVWVVVGALVIWGVIAAFSASERDKARKSVHGAAGGGGSRPSAAPDQTSRVKAQRSDFVPPTILVGDGRAFEQHVKRLLIKHGYQVVETPSSGDFGVDLVATKGNQKLAVQTKNLARPVGVSAVQEVSSGMLYYGADDAWVVSRSGFTTRAKQLAKATGVQLKQVDVAKGPTHEP